MARSSNDDDDALIVRDRWERRASEDERLRVSNTCNCSSRGEDAAVRECRDVPMSQNEVAWMEGDGPYSLNAVVWPDGSLMNSCMAG